MILSKTKIVSNILLVMHCIIALLLCLVFLNKFVEPKTFPYFELIALLYPILLAVHLIFTVVWLLKREIVFVPFFIFTLFLLFPLKKYIHFENNFKRESSSKDLKVMTYNVKYANNNKDLYALENYILKENIDIAFFHEIYTRQWRSKEIFLADRYNATFDLIGISSKFPIINKQKIILPGNAFACMVDVQKEQDIIRCISVYLEPMYLNKNIFKVHKLQEAKNNYEMLMDKLTTGFKKHEVQVDLLAKYIKDSPYPVIVCGDLNSVPLSYEYFTIKKDLNDVFEECGKGFGWTFYDYYYPIRIDYIFASESFKSKLCYVDKTVNYSDHYPVLAILQLGN